MKLLAGRSKNSALTELHQRYGKRVLGFFIKMTNGNIDQSQDFVQDLFLKIIEKHEQFDPTKRFYTWMFTIASNMVKTAYRSQRNIVQLETKHYPTEWGENEMEKNQFQTLLSKAIDKLENYHKQTFVLRYIEQLGVKEIAEITGASEGTVKSRIYYSTKKITKSLSELNPANDDKLFKLS